MASLANDMMNLSSLRRDFPILSRKVHRNRPLVYFDNAASTQRPRQVVEAMSAFYETDYSNVHRGVHALSQASSERFEHARETLAKFVNAADPREIVFTSGTTAGVNLVARGWGDANVGAGDEILLTEMEHHSNIVPWQQLAARTGSTVRFLPITDDGLALPRPVACVRYAANQDRCRDSLSNVLGTIVPLQPIVAAAKQVGALVFVDAAQHTPHEVTDVQQWGADFVAFSGHKMVGPTGIGVLWGRSDRLADMPPFLGGGSMITTVTTEGFEPAEPPAKFEAGTPPITEAIGLAAAVDYLQQIGMASIMEHERALATLAYELMSELPRVRILGPKPMERAGHRFLCRGRRERPGCLHLFGPQGIRHASRPPLCDAAASAIGHSLELPR